MKSYKETVLSHIAYLKKIPSGSSELEIGNSNSAIRLQLLTHDSLNDLHSIRLLARWRKKHEFWFPAQFPVTASRTAHWLRERVLNEPDRLLFMIDVHGTYRGHVGLYRFDFQQKSCEIDNIVRGRQGNKGMMEQSIRLLMAWGREVLGIRYYTLQTTSDNVRALALYGRLGFIETKRIPLVYTKTIDGGFWDIAPKEHTLHIKRYDVFMTRKESV